ncbi:basal-body rod modification protein FlgD [Campylobacterota bacterium]|nr:basal-body rod modification protein FlgD [Campylobacterota bacterium]
MATTAVDDFMGGAANQTITYNPKSALSKDDFLKLMMVQLQYQDPTSPMDTDKMLAQTSDMAVIESQANIQAAMENMVTQFQVTSAYQLVSSVGKLADTGLNAVQFTNQGAEYTDSLFYEEDFTNGVLTITDTNGDTIRTQIIKDGFKGLQDFTWDGRDRDGKLVPPGTYRIYAEYIGSASGKEFKSDLGVYPIESVVLNQEKPMLYLGGAYYTIDQIRAIKERGT